MYSLYTITAANPSNPKLRYTTSPKLPPIRIFTLWCWFRALPHGDCSLMHWLGVSNELLDARLLAVSPECKLESMKALWSTNTFSFAGYSPLQHWLRLMPQDKLAMIHHLRLEMWMRGSVTAGANTLAWAQAIERIPNEMLNLASFNLVLYLDGYLTCGRNSQAGRLTDMFKPLSRVRDLRTMTVVLNEDNRRLNSFHAAGAWCDQLCCDHFSLKAQDPEWRRQVGLMWAEEIRKAAPPQRRPWGS